MATFFEIDEVTLNYEHCAKTLWQEVSLKVTENTNYFF